jgi:hypothetical protein
LICCIKKPANIDGGGILTTKLRQIFLHKFSDEIWRRNVLTVDIIQSDQKENKAEQALQIIGHVVAEFYVNKRSMHGRRQFVDSNTAL